MGKHILTTLLITIPSALFMLLDVHLNNEQTNMTWIATGFFIFGMLTPFWYGIVFKKKK